MLDLPLQSAVLNILLHLVYSVPCDRYNPSLDTISAVFPALKVYGYSAQSMIPPHPDFSQVMIFHAPGDPLRVYALAASASLEALAVAASHFTLVTSLSSVTDALAAQMGPHYLRRLFFLHLGRVEALKLHLMSPPDMHESTPDCDFTEQKKLTRAWALATAYLAWDGRPDASPASLSASLTPLVEHLQCRPCRDLLQGRILTLIQNWSLVKTTI
ncbi:hypothetical protein BOTBODRAFT_31738 [Botryobasidium botryosum FD-172 SS1]|uniref:Uncharacterized protein n=1 Tax=Botryobasidium botryosum (strain FD-172 SS1) TaxID=930990 RepID=A0A067MI24_BOTB1|nr:hypothetical protein BOTBODRAFT_31738 [Botryobasidium botryosum FD-172 SS1]